MNRSSSLVRNVLSNYLVLAMNLAFALTITPIVVRALNTELYGVWSFLNGLLTYSELLYLGLGGAIVRYVAQYRAHNDAAAINRLAAVVVTIYSGLGLLCLAIFTGFSGLIPHAFGQPLSPASFEQATITCALLGAQLLFVFVGSAFGGILSGFDRFDIVNMVALGSMVVRFIGVPLFVRSGANAMVVLAVVTCVAAALQTIVLAWIAFRFAHGLSVRPVRPRGHELRLLYGFGLQSFFIILAAKLISYTDTTLIGVILGATAVGYYTPPLQLVENARSLISGFSTVFLPRLTVMVTRGEMDLVRDAYIRATRLATFVSGWLMAGLIVLGPAFLNRWLGAEYGTPVQWVIVYLAIAMFCQIISSQVPFAFYQALHLVAVPAAVLTAEAAINLGLSVFLAPRLQLTGVALATALPAFFVSAVALPPYLCRRLGIPVSTYISSCILPGLIVFAAAAGTLWLSGLLLPDATYPAIGARAALTIPVVALAGMAVVPADERADLLRRVSLR